jgi:hypothetical protein
MALDDVSLPPMTTAGTTSIPYVPRSQTNTPCYTNVQHHLATFIADREAEERPLPKYVIDEFEAFLACGIHQP